MQACVETSSDRAACKKYIINKHHIFIFDNKIDARSIRNQFLFSEIVPVKCSIEFAEMDFFCFQNGLKFFLNASSQKFSPRLKSDDHRLTKVVMHFYKLMTQPFY